MIDTLKGVSRKEDGNYLWNIISKSIGLNAKTKIEEFNGNYDLQLSDSFGDFVVNFSDVLDDNVMFEVTYTVDRYLDALLKITDNTVQIRGLYAKNL